MYTGLGPPWKDPPGTSDSPLISPSFSSGQRNRAYWASQPQKSVTLQPQPGGGTTKSERTCGGIGGKKSTYTGLHKKPLLFLSRFNQT